MVGKDKSAYINKNIRGFTLVELVIVIGVLATLALLLVPRIINYFHEAENAKEISNARMIANEIMNYNSMAELNGTDTIPKSLPDSEPVELTNDMLESTTLALPDSGVFPDSSIVKIMIDTDGNAYIHVKD